MANQFQIPCELDLIVPQLKGPITEDEYLSMLKFDNGSSFIDYGEIMDCDPEEARQLNEFLKAFQQK